MWQWRMYCVLCRCYRQVGLDHVAEEDVLCAMQVL